MLAAGPYFAKTGKICGPVYPQLQCCICCRPNACREKKQYLAHGIKTRYVDFIKMEYGAADAVYCLSAVQLAAAKKHRSAQIVPKFNPVQKLP